MNNNTPLWIMMVIVLVLLYSVAHDNFSDMDAAHCMENKATYGGTSLLFQGYCVQNGIRIPATTFRSEQ